MGGFSAFGGEGVGFACGGEEVGLASAWDWANRRNSHFFSAANDDVASTEEEGTAGVMEELVEVSEAPSIDSAIVEGVGC